MNKSINFIKCACAFFVICMHCELHNYGGKIGTIIIALMRLAVPIFFLISGYYSCFKEQQKDKRIIKYKNRIWKLLKLIIISGIVYLLLDIFLFKKYINIQQYFNTKWNQYKIFQYIFLNLSPFAGHLWFLSALLYCYITVIILEKLNITISILYKYIPILLLVNILLGEMSNNIGLTVKYSMYYRNFIFYALPFFLIGYAIKDKWGFFEKIKNKYLLLINICSLILIIIEVLGTKNSDLYIGNIIQSVTIFIWAIKNQKALNINPFVKIGEVLYTYIYIYHLMVLDILKMYQKKQGIQFKDVCYINTIIVFIITIIISIIIYYCSIIRKRKMVSLTKNKN